MPKVLVALVCYNTCDATERVLGKFPKNRDYDVLIVNDGSTDNTRDVFKKYNFKTIEHSINKGLGATIKTAVRYALDNCYDIIVIMAGNGKDNPQEIHRIIRPFVEDKVDYIQGSRFLQGGSWDNLSLFRYVMIKSCGFFLSFLTGVKVTDPLNGFRAYRLAIFNDPRINIWQDWLNRYEYETYLNFNVLRLGFKYKEIAVSKLYPVKSKRIKCSHIRPVIDWWSIVRPIILILFKIRK